MISIIKIKICIASIYMFSIIISKFCYNKKLYLVILFQVDKNLKVSLYYIILFLDLTINLKIKSS